MTQQLLIGDGDAIDDALYRIPVTESEASLLSILIQEEACVAADFYIERGRETTRRHGTIKKDGYKSYVIRLNKPSIGALLHEMAHIGKNGLPIDNWNHTGKFKNQLRHMVAAYHAVKERGLTGDDQ
jgi:hypothetical protein